MHFLISTIFKYRFILGFLVLVIAFTGIASWRYLIRPPADFPKSVLLNIKASSSTDEVAKDLVARKIIQNETAFQFFIWLYGREHKIVSGDYAFSRPINSSKIAHRLATGDRGILPIRVTIPEGTDIDDIGLILLKKIPGFNASEFYSKALAQQGYLFPDTYFFQPDVTADQVITIMRNTFDKKLATLKNTWVASELLPTKNAVISMAAILEKEAPTSESRRIISDILWRRLAINMPLQVDVAPDTYKTKGLPKLPITNPGIGAIGDALTPTPTKYWYYISDNDGGMHYAKTFDEHRANILKYLK